MSIARQLLHDFRPLFRMLDEPLTRPSSIAFNRSRSLLDDPFGSPFFSRDMLRGPAVDVSEAGNTYMIEAELPGLKKEQLEVRVGDGGRSLTIEGKLLAASVPEGGENSNTPVLEGENTTQNATQISTERAAFGTFSRTVYLPRPVDSNSVAAKLNDGILQITLNKAEDKGSVVVKVE
ncbi:HSP20-like chaperone [Mycena alexandri]|uniref:HSP20-like chaperone n=1 Tax=Mycena alexandri TaxID=1745969 RepID=A0AAD6TDR7_9AGAR|nr:HSP20-like chaperone [Mycena alexandri]